MFWVLKYYLIEILTSKHIYLFFTIFDPRLIDLERIGSNLPASVITFLLAKNNVFEGTFPLKGQNCQMYANEDLIETLHYAIYMVSFLVNVWNWTMSIQ